MVCHQYGDRTHASRPTQRVVSVCSFFLHFFLVLSYRPSHCFVRYLSLSFLSLPSAALQLSIRCQSVNFSFCLRSPHLPPYPPPLTAFRSRISASLLNNCPLREELKGHVSKEPIESKDREMHHRCGGILIL